MSMSIEISHSSLIQKKNSIISSHLSWKNGDLGIRSRIKQLKNISNLPDFLLLLQLILLHQDELNSKTKMYNIIINDPQKQSHKGNKVFHCLLGTCENERRSI